MSSAVGATHSCGVPGPSCQLPVGRAATRNDELGHTPLPFRMFACFPVTGVGMRVHLLAVQQLVRLADVNARSGMSRAHRIGRGSSKRGPSHPVLGDGSVRGICRPLPRSADR